MFLHHNHLLNQHIIFLNKFKKILLFPNNQIKNSIKINYLMLMVLYHNQIYLLKKHSIKQFKSLLMVLLFIFMIQLIINYHNINYKQFHLLTINLLSYNFFLQILTIKLKFFLFKIIHFLMFTLLILIDLFLFLFQKVFYPIKIILFPIKNLLNYQYFSYQFLKQQLILIFLTSMFNFSLKIQTFFFLLNNFHS